MFTGIVGAQGRVESVSPNGGKGKGDGGRVLRIRVPFRGLKKGESIAINGACLTVERVVKGGFTVHVVQTTEGRTLFAEYAPGRRRSAGTVAGSIATLIVIARSAADMPVVTPNRAAASMLTVNAVSCDSVLCSAIWGSPRAWQRSGVSVRQMSPRPNVAMKLIISGVTRSAAPIRSPSFSRASSSATMTSFPARMSAIARSTDPNAIVVSRTCPARPLPHAPDCRAAALRASSAPG